MRKSIIVGVDPGTTTGIAIVDTKGNVLLVHSQKGMGIKTLIKIIQDYGNPVVIATDVSPPPKTVEKLCKTFSCRLYYPKQNLSVSEKETLAKSVDVEIKDTHQRDSLASALKAYKNFEKLFKKVEKTLARMKKTDMYDSVVEVVVKNHSENIVDVVRSLEKEEQPKEVKKRKRLPKEVKAIVDALRKRLEKQREEIERLRRKLKEKSEKVIYLTEEKVERQIKNLEEKVKIREKALSLLAEIRKVEKEGFVPIINLGAVSKDLVYLLKKYIDFKDVWVYSTNEEDAKIVPEVGMEGFIIPKVESLVTSHLKIIEMEFYDNAPVLRLKREMIEKKLTKSGKRRFLEWLESYRKRKF